VTIDPATVKPAAYVKSLQEVAAVDTGLARPFSYVGDVFARVYFADPAPK
jgi:hypothetical protein